MTRTGVIALILVSFLGFKEGNAEGAKTSAAKNEKIVLLLETTGSLKIGKQIASALFNQFIAIWKQNGAALDDKAMDKLKTGLEDSMDKEMKIGTPLVSELIGLYSKYYSEKNIDDMLSFYKSETGKRVIETMPNVVSESMAIGQKWGKENANRIAMEVIKNLKKEGYKIPEI
jgi:uncharacterized protein